MANSAARAACSRPSSKARRERSAQRIERSIEASAWLGVTGYPVHSSNAITMSAPSSRWISIERSGESMWREPSRWLRNATPSSLCWVSADRLITW